MKRDFRAKIPGSQYFTWGEALWMPKLQKYAEPTTEQEANIKRQAAALDKVRDHFNQPLIIHCWLRTPEYNKLVGGAAKSMHLQGLATDFHVKGVDCEQAKRELMSKPELYPGRGEINSIGWIHLDLKAGPWFKV